jgi:cysteine dioxygenase
MDGLKSLSELIKTLMHANAEDYVKIAKGMDIPLENFKKYIHWKKEGYSRNCIIKTDDFELILICWNKDDITPIHGHDNKKCWVYQVDGEMTEIRYKQDSEGNLDECNRMTLTPGKLCYMQDDMGYHMLQNESNQNAITLHLYIKPVEKCAVYNSKEECFEERILSFHSIEGVLTN